MGISVNLDVKMNGPIFDRSADRAVDDFLAEAARQVAEAGVNEVQARLGSVLQHDTGHYRGQVTTDRATSEGSWIVTDGGVVYGPWLEGTSSRNKTTRFKGYQTFRRARQWLAGKAGDIAENSLPRYVKEMGG